MQRRLFGLIVLALVAPAAAFSLHAPLHGVCTPAIGSCSASAHTPARPYRCSPQIAALLSEQQTKDAAPAKQQTTDDLLAEQKATDDEEGWTLQKVANLGVAGVISIAVAETVFWVLSFPFSELVYYFATGEWINLLEQEGQLKFLAFTAGWGALGGVIAQYRTVLTAAAMTPWMDRNVVQPYLGPVLNRLRNKD